MIREAITRYLNAKSEVLEARAEKARCMHVWDEIGECPVYAEAAWRPYKTVHVYVCAKCGEHKKITVP